MRVLRNDRRAGSLVRAWLIAILCNGLNFATRGDEGDKFEVLHAGAQTFSNVTVVNRTTTDVFLRHAGGLTSVKVQDLEPEVQRQLGFVVEAPPEEKSVMEKIDLAPRLDELQSHLQTHSQLMVEQWGPKLVFGVIAGSTLLYLLWSVCCLRICRKAGIEPGILIWLPILKKIPLLKASGLRGVWLAVWIFPLTAAIGWGRWAFAICRVLGKPPILAALMILPITSLFAFLYLVLSREGGSEEAAMPGQLVLR